jgi:hypothetical protein
VQSQDYQWSSASSIIIVAQSTTTNHHIAGRHGRIARGSHITTARHARFHNALRATTTETGWAAKSPLLPSVDTPRPTPLLVVAIFISIIVIVVVVVVVVER